MQILKILLNKEFPENKIYVKGVESTQTYHQEIRNIIEEKWKGETKKSEERGMPIFNGRLVRFEGFEANKKLTFFTSNTSFKDVIGIRPANSIVSEYGLQYTANALSVNIVCTTKDKKIIVLNRYFAGYGDYWSLLSSFAYARRDKKNPALAVRNCLKKELLINSDKIVKNIMIGLYGQPEIAETTAVFKTKISLDTDQIVKNLDKMDSSQKLFYDYKFLDDKKNSIVNFLRRYKGKIHQGAYTSLKLYLKTKKSE